MNGRTGAKEQDKSRVPFEFMLTQTSSGRVQQHFFHLGMGYLGFRRDRYKGVLLAQRQVGYPDVIGTNSLFVSGPRRPIPYTADRAEGW